MKRAGVLLLLAMCTASEALLIGKIPNCTYQSTTGLVIVFNRSSCDSCLCTALQTYNLTEIIMNCFDHGIRCELFKNYSDTYFMVPNQNSTFYFHPNLPPSITSSSAAPILRWNKTGLTVAGVTAIASSALNHLRNPYGLVFDSNNSLYIADSANHRILKYSSGAFNGTTVAGQSNGTTGTSSAELNRPWGLVFDSAENMYFTEHLNHRVMFWSKGATSGSVIAGSTGVPGTTNHQFNGPSGLARLNSTGILYIADAYNHRIMQYLANASSGTIVAGGNGPGTNLNQLYHPFCFAFDEVNNTFMIANYGSHNIVRWTIGKTSWTLVAGVTGVPGNSEIHLNAPLNVVLDPFGNLYVADMQNHRIQMFLMNESNATTVAGVTSSFGTDATKLNMPYWVILDSDLNLYVADTYNHRVQKFLRL